MYLCNTDVLYLPSHNPHPLFQIPDCIIHNTHFLCQCSWLFDIHQWQAKTTFAHLRKLGGFKSLEPVTARELKIWMMEHVSLAFLPSHLPANCASTEQGTVEHVNNWRSRICQIKTVSHNVTLGFDECMINSNWKHLNLVVCDILDLVGHKLSKSWLKPIHKVKMTTEL